MCRHTGTHACVECVRDGCLRWLQQTETDCHARQTRPLWWRGVSFLFYTSHFALLMTFADSQSQNYESLILFIFLHINLFSTQQNQKRLKSQAFKFNFSAQISAHTEAQTHRCLWIFSWTSQSGCLWFPNMLLLASIVSLKQKQGQQRQFWHLIHASSLGGLHGI